MILIVMGVEGSGKTSVGKLLAGQLGWKFFEGDDFHPPENIAKMSQGIPLNDEDRIPWLEAIRKIIIDLIQRGENAVITCSALKKAYREMLLVDDPHVRFVYLKGDYDLIMKRLKGRQHHFMRPGMLESQFEALEEPEKALVVNIDQTPQAIVDQIKEKLGL